MVYLRKRKIRELTFGFLLISNIISNKTFNAYEYTYIYIYIYIYVARLLYLSLLPCSAGLTVRGKIKGANPLSSNDIFNKLHKTIQGKDFSNILTMGSEQRIDDFEYPRKMRNMQKFAVRNLSTSHELREKVS